MNILFTNNQEFDPQIGGVEKVSVIIAEELIKHGHRVFFSALKKSVYSKGYSLCGEQQITGDSEELAEFIKTNHIDVMLNQAGNDLEYTRLCHEAAIECGIKMYSEIHIDPFYTISGIKDCHLDALDESPYQMAKNVIKSLILPIRIDKEKKKITDFYRYIFGVSDKVILLSESYLDPLKEIIEKDQAEKICVIPNPVPYKNSEELKKEKIVLYVGRINEAQKRTDRLIRIWEKIYKKHPDWELHILGDGEAREKLQRYIRKKGIMNVRFMGFIDPVEEYKKAEILCMTSAFEGLAMVLIEAQEYGCIPIAYNTFSSLSDIIRNDINGYIIEKVNWKPFAIELEKLMNSPEKRKAMRKEMPGILRSFDKDMITGKWTRLFESGK